MDSQDPCLVKADRPDDDYSGETGGEIDLNIDFDTIQPEYGAGIHTGYHGISQG